MCGWPAQDPTPSPRNWGWGPWCEGVRGGFAGDRPVSEPLGAGGVCSALVQRPIAETPIYVNKTENCFATEHQSSEPIEAGNKLRGTYNRGVVLTSGPRERDPHTSGIVGGGEWKGVGGQSAEKNTYSVEIIAAYVFVPRFTKMFLAINAAWRGGEILTFKMAFFFFLQLYRINWTCFNTDLFHSPQKYFHYPFPRGVSLLFSSWIISRSRSPSGGSSKYFLMPSKNRSA